MLSGINYYHGTTKNIIVAFGRLFSDIQVERHDNAGALAQTISVPIGYSNKEKWVVRVDSDPTLENETLVTLPRLAFEITGYQYDSTRKLSKMNSLICNDAVNPTRKQVYVPTPYNIDLSLYIIAKTQEDSLQILEQILPYFTPEYTMSVSVVPEMNIVHDIPIILNSVQVEDDYDGSFQKRRTVIHTLRFKVKANFYGPVTNPSIIKTTNTSLKKSMSPSAAELAHHTANQATPVSVITESWSEF